MSSSSSSSTTEPVGTSPSFVGTYPSDDAFWVPAAESEEYPLRYGDVFTTPDRDECRDGKGRAWLAVMAVHPSCELGAKGAPTGVQVVRVHRLREVGTRSRDEIRAGFVERDGGIAVARANFVYLAPVPDDEKLGEELFADLRATARVDLADLTEHRRAAMSHDARLALLRRDLYFRYRWPVTLEAVTDLERNRIAGDAAFVGPRPHWAS